MYNATKVLILKIKRVYPNIRHTTDIDISIENMSNGAPKGVINLKSKLGNLMQTIEDAIEKDENISTEYDCTVAVSGCIDNEGFFQLMVRNNRFNVYQCSPRQMMAIG